MDDGTITKKTTVTDKTSSEVGRADLFEAAVVLGTKKWVRAVPSLPIALSSSVLR